MSFIVGDGCGYDFKNFEWVNYVWDLFVKLYYMFFFGIYVGIIDIFLLLFGVIFYKFFDDSFEKDVYKWLRDFKWVIIGFFWMYFFNLLIFLVFLLFLVFLYWIRLRGFVLGICIIDILRFLMCFFFYLFSFSGRLSEVSLVKYFLWIDCEFLDFVEIMLVLEDFGGVLFLFWLEFLGVFLLIE